MFLLVEITVQVMRYGLWEKLVLLEKIYPIRRSVHILWIHSCTDPESFVRNPGTFEGFFFFFFFSWWSDRGSKNIIARLRDAISMAFRWRANNGPAGIFMNFFSGDPGRYVIFQGGGGGSGPPAPLLWIHPWQDENSDILPLWIRQRRRVY